MRGVGSAEDRARWAWFLEQPLDVGTPHVHPNIALGYRLVMMGWQIASLAGGSRFLI